MVVFLSYNAPVFLLGGGFISETDKELLFAVGFDCVAADGGADVAVEAGIDLKAVVGDFDSLSESAKARIPAERHHHIAEQDSTDFAKCLRSIKAPVIVAVGFGGGRVDHQLAVLHNLVMYPECPCIVLDQQEIIFHCPRHLVLPTQKGDVVSLFPLSEVQGRSTGLKWPIEGIGFAPDRYVGTSNCAGGAITLEMDCPGMLCILPRRMLAGVIGILQDLPVEAKWPARER